MVKEKAKFNQSGDNDTGIVIINSQDVNIRIESPAGAPRTPKEKDVLRRKDFLRARREWVKRFEKAGKIPAPCLNLTVDSFHLDDFINQWLDGGKPFVLVSGPGTGKTVFSYQVTLVQNRF